MLTKKFSGKNSEEVDKLFNDFFADKKVRFLELKTFYEGGQFVKEVMYENLLQIQGKDLLLEKG